MTVKKKKQANSQLIAICALVGAGLLVLVIGYFEVVAPQRSKAAAVVTKIADDQTAVTVAEGASAKPIPFRATDLFRLANAMPSDPDMTGLILDLRQVATVSSVKLSSVRPSPEVPLALGYYALPVSIVVAGRYQDISRFVRHLRTNVRFGAGQRLEVQGRLFDANSIALAPATPTTGATTPASGTAQSTPQAKHQTDVDTLSATLALDAFVYGGQAPLTATAGLSAPTSTTTAGSGT